jgi:hypothetical protein
VTDLPLPPGRGPKEPEPLSESVTHLVEEARMLIPGVTVILGFQLVTIFQAAFDQKLTHEEQIAHLVAIFVTLVSLMLLLTPAAYHRQVERGWVSQGFVRLSSRVITAATPAFAIGVTIDFYVLVRIVTRDVGIAAAAAIAVLTITVLLWYVMPRFGPMSRALRGD